MALSHQPGDAGARDFLAAARARGLLTIALGADEMDADHAFAVPERDPAIVQEVQETAYHVLWELVHVFFDHPALLESSCVTCGDAAVEATVVSARGASATVRVGNATEEVAAELVGDLASGDRVLCHAGVALERLPPRIPAAGCPLPVPGGRRRSGPRHRARGRCRLHAAQGRGHHRAAAPLDLPVADALRRRGPRGAGGGRPAALPWQRRIGHRRPGPGRRRACARLAGGRPRQRPATVTAVGNDVGFEKVFARQLIPLARRGDVAIAISTSGSRPTSSRPSRSARVAR